MAAGEVDLPLEPLNAPAINNQTGTAAANSGSLWQMLVFAFLGGLILNFMPCVLPVIALKILGFVNQSNENPKRVRQLGLVYGAGVLASFLALAGLVIAVQAAGHKAGWGMQFQSPVFVVALAALVTLVALNLFGVFEFNLGGGALDAAGKLSSRHGASGAFFNGVLMTLLATPCTAPFLAPALGFAFAQPAAVVVLFFLTIGAGLALPYVALSRQPAWLKFLPKPGAWMEKFKIAMGFPMLATVVWLCDVASAYYGERTWWLGVFLVVLALAAWVFGEFVQRGRAWKGFARIAVFILVAAGFGFILENELRWRTALEDMGDVPLQQSADGIAWQKWSAAAVNEARLAGHPVLVDFTAKWCTTCRVNKATSLEIPSVRAKLKEMDAVALLGDYTKFSADIAAELARFGRPGVPLVLVYPADVSQPPQVLPALLTPGIVLEALNKSAPAESKHK
jgi:thiol:disulfide interchange protein DsbD